MKRILTIIAIAFLSLGTLFAQERIIFYNGANPIHTQMIENVDSVSFVNNISIVHNNIGETNFQFPVIGIDSIVFSDEEVQVDTGDIIYITYNGNSASIINPWANRGVTVTANGADVTIMAASGTPDIIYYLSGTTSDGSLLVQSDRRINLIMHGVSITNPTGAAIKIIEDVKISAHLEGTSTLVDGGDATTHKAAFDSEGQIEFSGNGTLNVNGNVKHGIFSNDYIRILSGNIKVNNAVTDGLHCDYFQMYTGSVEVENAKTGIDGDRGFIEINGGTITVNVAQADGKGITCDSTFTMSGGTINMTLSGGQSKGIKAGQSIGLDGGTITINGSGATVVTDNDPSHCTGLKSDGSVYVNSGANLTVTMSSAATGGKGINADGRVVVNGGNVNLSVAGAGGTYTNTSNQSDSYSASCIKSNGDIEINSQMGNTVMQLNASGTNSKGFSTDGNVTINGGNLTFTASGVDSKGISADRNITVNDGSLTFTASGNVSKAMKADVALLVENGTVNVTASGSTVVTSGNPAYCSGLKSSGTLTINGGDVTVTCTNTNTGGRCLSSDGNMTIGGGTLTLKTQGSGTTYTSGNTTDGYGPVCIATDGNFTVTAGVIDCQSTGTGGRGIKVEGITTIGVQGGDNELIDIDLYTSGAPVGGSGGGGGGWPPGGGGTTNYCKPKGLKSVGNIYIHSGHISSYCAQTSGDPTGEAIESKDGIYINGGFVEANSYDDAINCANHIEVNGGYVWAYARGNDGIDCNGAYSQYNGGIIIAAGTEEAIDANCDGMGGTQGHLQINGATIIVFRASSGGGGMGGGMALLDSPTYMNGQKYLAPSNISTGNRYCIKNSGGDPVMIFNHQAVSGSGFMTSTSGLRPPGGGGSSASFIFTSPEVTSGTYTLYSNPTINGTVNWHGLYVGATATTSGSGTSVSAQ